MRKRTLDNGSQIGGRTEEPPLTGPAFSRIWEGNDRDIPGAAIIDRSAFSRIGQRNDRGISRITIIDWSTLTRIGQRDHRGVVVNSFHMDKAGQGEAWPFSFLSYFVWTAPNVSRGHPMLCQMEEACSENAGGKEVEKGEGQMKK